MLCRMILNLTVSAIFGVRHFEFCNKMLYFMNTLMYCYKMKLVTKVRNFPKMLIAFDVWAILAMKLVLTDSLGHAENMDANFAISSSDCANKN